MKTYFLMLLVLAFFSESGVAQQVSAPRPGTVGTWRLLGVLDARLSVDHDKVFVKGPYDYFRKIKFKVTGAPLEIYKMIVRYDDGGRPETISTRFNIPRGGESRIIDLRGGSRKLRSIEFWYKTIGVYQGRAKVSLFGIK